MKTEIKVDACNGEFRVKATTGGAVEIQWFKSEADALNGIQAIKAKAESMAQSLARLNAAVQS